MIFKKLLAFIVAACMIMSLSVMAADAPAGDSDGQQADSQSTQAQDGESGDSQGDSEGDSEGGSDGESAEGESNGDSAGMMGSSYIRIKDNELTIAQDGDWIIEGEIPESSNITGIRFTAGSGSESFLSVSSSEHTDALTDGFTAVLGDGQELYPAPNFAQVYSNDGLNPNLEGFDLDYHWIGQIDWNEESPTYGQLTAVTPPGKELLSSLLDNAAYSVYIEANSKNDEAGGRGATQVSVGGGAAVLVQNAYIYSDGAEGTAVSNSGTSGIGSTMVVKDSLLAARGYVPSSAGSSENMPNDALLVTGADRTNLSGGESLTYYYDSALTVDGWASLSTDAAQGNGVDLVAVNTFASALLGGYGTYSDTNCRSYLYGCVMEGAEMGIIMSGTGRIDMYDGQEGLEGGEGYGVGLNGDIDPYAFADKDYSGLGGSVVAGGRYAIMMHSAGRASDDPQTYFHAKNSTLITDKELQSDENTPYSINASWYGRELSPNIQKYIEYTQGADIIIKSVNAEVILDNVRMESYSNVLILAVVNSDTSVTETPADANTAGNHVTLKNMEADGNIVDEDYERIMTICLDNTVLNGTVISGTCDSWTQYWLDAGYVEDYTIGYASNTFGSAAPLDTFVHSLVMNEDGTYTINEYGNDRGTELSLINGTVWNVAETGNVTFLSVEEGSVINGTVTVDGEAVDTSAGGEWTGNIVIEPAQ